MLVIGGCGCRELGCSAAESVPQHVRPDDAVGAVRVLPEGAGAGLASAGR